MAGHELADAGEERLLAGAVAEVEVFGEQRFFEARRDGGVRQQRLDFGGEGEQVAVPIVVEGLFAEAVAGAEQRAGVLVPDGEGEHAAEARDAIRPVLLVGVQDGFGVAAGAVSMAGLFEGGTEIGVIEDLAVIGDPEGAVFVGHGLVAAGDIDDAEAAVAQGGEGIAVVAGAVRAAMADRCRSCGRPPSPARRWGRE